MIIPDGHPRHATPARTPAAPLSVKTVAAPFRSNEQIADLLERIATQPHFPDELTLRRALNILDDLAEEMIGRHGPAEVTIKVQIQIHTERLRTWIPS